MKKLVFALLILATTARAEITWQQTAGISCLAGAGLMAITHPKTVYNGAVTTKKYVRKNPGKIIIGLGTLGLAFLVNREIIHGLSDATHLANKLKKLFK